ncbi:MAG: hypothetical protein DRI69_11365 [Bacteroidetes bacterium]|nr:MAG: hypothetical protein DRI69_11365 [Bacteroidota bacterium]
MAKRLIDPDKAFEKYYSIGVGRSIAKLYEKLHKTTPKSTPSYDSLKRWSVKYKWQDRVLLRDNAVREGLEASSAAVVVEAKIKELEHLYNGLSTVDDSILLISDTLNTCTATDPETGKKKVTILPETTQDMAALYNAQTRFVAAKVKLVETVRKIRGESDTVKVTGAVNVSLDATLKEYEKVINKIATSDPTENDS